MAGGIGLEPDRGAGTTGASVIPASSVDGIVHGHWYILRNSITCIEKHFTLFRCCMHDLYAWLIFAKKSEAVYVQYQSVPTEPTLASDSRATRGWLASDTQVTRERLARNCEWLARNLRVTRESVASVRPHHSRVLGRFTSEWNLRVLLNWLPLTHGGGS